LNAAAVAAGSSRTRLRVEGMTCGGCVARVETALRSVPGVVDARVDLTTGVAVVQADRGAASRRELIDAVRRTGYDADTFREDEPAAAGLDRTFQARAHAHKQAFVQALACGLPIMALHWLGPVLQSGDAAGHLWPTVIQALLCTLMLGSAAGAPILVGGLRALIHRSANMDLLISTATGAAFVTSMVNVLRGEAHATHFDPIAMILVFINAGRYIETRARRDASQAIASLVRRMPRTAQRLNGTELETVPVDSLRPGDRVQVAVDMIVPVDGTILSGQAAVDESAVTGESMPRSRRPRDRVYAGTLVRAGLIAIEAARVGADSTIGRIIRAVEEAQAGKTRMQRIADRVAGGFVPFVILIAVVTLFASRWIGVMAWSEAIERAVAVLVIACPCAMGLATPTAILVATGAAALQGILVRDAAAMEAAARVNSVLFDKTGTLTSGAPTIVSVNPACIELVSGGDERLLQIAASVEQYSQHPVARAIMERARSSALRIEPAERVASEPGRGIAGFVNGENIRVGSARFLEDAGIPVDRPGTLPASSDHDARTTVFVAVNDRCVGSIALGDRIRPHAAEAIAELKRRGINAALLTGDRLRPAQAVAGPLGIDDVIVEMTPQDKAVEVVKRRSAGQCVAFVGDGINDAPALAVADVGITFASATDVAAGAADITILHDDLSRISTLITLAHRTVRIIKQNLFWAFFYNAVAIPLAALGQVPPGYAAAAMMASSISVVLNSLRLRGPSAGGEG
jgi:Cu+-exporting ATPase